MSLLALVVLLSGLVPPLDSHLQPSCATLTWSDEPLSNGRLRPEEGRLVSNLTYRDGGNCEGTPQNTCGSLGPTSIGFGLLAKPEYARVAFDPPRANPYWTNQAMAQWAASTRVTVEVSREAPAFKLFEIKVVAEGCGTPRVTSTRTVQTDYLANVTFEVVEVDHQDRRATWTLEFSNQGNGATVVRLRVLQGGYAVWPGLSDVHLSGPAKDSEAIPTARALIRAEQVPRKENYVLGAEATYDGSPNSSMHVQTFRIDLPWTVSPSAETPAFNGDSRIPSPSVGVFLVLLAALAFVRRLC